MEEVMEKIKKRELEIDNSAENFLFHHPFIGCFLITIGVPAFILLAVTICITVIMLPISYFVGWL